MIPCINTRWIGSLTYLSIAWQTRKKQVILVVIVFWYFFFKESNPKIKFFVTGEIKTRLETINDYFTFSLYANVCRSLFEKDKLLFAFLVCVRILIDSNNINPEEYQFLLAGGVAKKVSKRFVSMNVTKDCRRKVVKSVIRNN